MIGQPKLAITARDFHLIMYEFLKPEGYLEQKYGDDVAQFRDTEIGMALLELLAGLGDIVSDIVSAEGQETNMITAREIQRIIDMAESRGYSPRTAKSSSIFARLFFGDFTGALIVPKGFRAATPDTGDGQIIFETAYEYVKSDNGNNYLDVTMEQGESVVEPIFTSTGNILDRIELSKDSIDVDSLTVSIDGVDWTRVTNFIGSDATSPHYRLVTAEYVPDAKTYLIEFGNNLYGKYPPEGSTVQTSYRTSEGANGNIPAANLSEVLDVLTALDDTELDVTVQGLSDATGGISAETIDEIRVNSYVPTVTNSRMVSKDDYSDAARTVGGLKRAVTKTKNEWNLIPENTNIVFGCIELGVALTTAQAETAKEEMLAAYPSNGTSRLLVVPCEFVSFVMEVNIKAYLGASLIDIENDAKFIIEHMLSLDGQLGISQSSPIWVLDIGQEVNPWHFERELNRIPGIDTIQVKINGENNPYLPDNNKLPYASAVTYNISHR